MDAGQRRCQLVEAQQRQVAQVGEEHDLAPKTAFGDGLQPLCGHVEPADSGDGMGRRQLPCQRTRHQRC